MLVFISIFLDYKQLNFMLYDVTSMYFPNKLAKHHHHNLKRKLAYNLSPSLWQLFVSKVVYSRFPVQFSHCGKYGARDGVITIQMYSSTSMITNNHDFIHGYFNEFPVSNIMVTFMESTVSPLFFSLASSWHQVVLVYWLTLKLSCHTFSQDPVSHQQCLFRG